MPASQYWQEGKGSAAVLEVKAPSAALDLVLIVSRCSEPRGLAHHELVVYAPEPPDFGDQNDPSLFVNVAITRAHGFAVFGPPAKQLIAPIPKDVVCRGMERESLRRARTLVTPC